MIGGGLFAKAAIGGTETTYRSFHRLYEGAVVLSQVKGWEGAIARCPAELEDWFVSPEYRTFRCKPNQASSSAEICRTRARDQLTLIYLCRKWTCYLFFQCIVSCKLSFFSFNATGNFLFRYPDVMCVYKQ